MTQSMMHIFFLAALAADSPAISPSEQTAIADALMPSMVKVQYTLQYDKGQAPVASGWSQRCPNCGQYHTMNQTDDLFTDERPFETPGYLVSKTQVFTPDILLHPRFIKSVAVRVGDQEKPARIAGYARNQNALMIELASPIDTGKPLVFGDKDEPPYYAITFVQGNGGWTLGIQPIAKNVSITDTGRQFISIPSNSIITDKAGRPLGLSMRDELPLDDSWKGSPLKWSMLDAEKMEKAVEQIAITSDASLLHVSLHLRSPRTNKSEDMWSYRYSSNNEDDTATQHDVLGLLVDDKHVLVLADLKPKVTARLERIVVHTGKDEPITAKFSHTLSDFGCLLAILDKPIPGAISVSGENILRYHNTLILGAEITMKNEERVSYYSHSRIPTFKLGWRGQVYPELSGGGTTMFLFDEGGRLIAVPLTRRKKVTVRGQWDSSEASPTPIAYVLPLIEKISQHADPNNVPLSEEQENRIAWLGVELQALDQNLARINNVADLTGDGQSGALVTFVYPDSPAEQAGIQTGYVLLRLHVDGHPKPLEVQMQNTSYGSNEFPWEQLSSGQVPAEYLERLPKPWPSAENSFTRSLTELGFGTHFKADFWHEGKLITKDFEVVESPPHHDSAPRYKSEILGLTVRNLTYEAKRYFQILSDDAGVVVSKIEPGGKAAVAGILPYELITRINDRAVNSVKDFENAVAGGGELRLSLKRQSRGRLVKIHIPVSTSKSTD